MSSRECALKSLNYFPYRLTNPTKLSYKYSIFWLNRINLFTEYFSFVPFAVFAALVVVLLTTGVPLHGESLPPHCPAAKKRLTFLKSATVIKQCVQCVREQCRASA